MADKTKESPPVFTITAIDLYFAFAVHGLLADGAFSRQLSAEKNADNGHIRDAIAETIVVDAARIVRLMQERTFESDEDESADCSD